MVPRLPFRCVCVDFCRSLLASPGSPPCPGERDIKMPQDGCPSNSVNGQYRRIVYNLSYLQVVDGPQIALLNFPVSRIACGCWRGYQPGGVWYVLGLTDRLSIEFSDARFFVLRCLL